MKFLININKSIISENTSGITQQLDEIDAIENSIDSNLNKDARIPSDVLNSFVIKDELNQDIWPNNKLSKEVRLNLIKIAQDFIKGLELPKNITIKDIIFTGSLANYNWSKFSDIDLHVVLDFKQFDADPSMVSDYFYAQKSIWNQEHDITISKFPVELYVQDINDKLVATSVYSVLNDEWIKKPTREEFKLDKKAIKDKALSFIRQLKDIRTDYQNEDYESVVDKVKRLKDKIKQMRNAGLEKGGELSLENMVFKVLRRTDFMDILDSYKAKSYDKSVSIDEEQPMKDIIRQKLSEATKYLPYDPRPELKASSYSSLSNPSYKLDIDKIRFRINKALNIAKEYKETNDDNYFLLPDEGNGFYQVEFRHDGQIKTKHIKSSGDMQQMGGKFQPSDVGVCKDFQNIAKYCFVKAGKNRGAFGSSPAEDAANKALIIFKDEILDFYANGSYNDGKGEELSKEKMSDKQAQHKVKKDLETKLGRNLSDSEWNTFLKTGEEPKKKSGLTMDPEKAAELDREQELLRAKIAARLNRKA